MCPTTINPEVVNLTSELESCGVSISRRDEVIERLQESWWNRHATLATLIRNGERIRIVFRAPATAFSAVLAVFLKNGFDRPLASDCAKRICCL